MMSENSFHNNQYELEKRKSSIEIINDLGNIIQDEI